MQRLFRNSWVVCTAAMLGATLAPTGRAVEFGGNTYSTDTTLADGDTWSSGNVTIDGGVTVTLPGGAELSFTAGGGPNLYGPGTFRNEGTFTHESVGGTNIGGAGAGRFENVGTFNFASSGDFRLDHSGYVFENTGTIQKTTTSGEEPSFFFDVDGQFLNSGDIEVTNGELTLGVRGESTGGNFSVDGSGSILAFEGVWTELTGTVTLTNGGQARLTDRDPAGTTGGEFKAGAATTILNLGGDGVSWYNAKINLNGNLLRNDGLLRIDSSPTKQFVAGSDTFSNAGTVEYSEGTIDLAGNTFSNAGTMRIISGGTKRPTDSIGGGVFENAAAGTLNWQGSGGTTLTLDGVDLDNHGTANVEGGPVHTLAGTGSFHNQTGGTLNLKADSHLELEGGDLVNDGTAVFFGEDGNRIISGSADFVNNGTFNHAYGGNGDNLDLRVDFLNYGTFDFQDRGDLLINGGSVLSNHGVFKKSVHGGDPSFVFTSGRFVNEAGGEVLSEAGNLNIATDGANHSDPGSTWTADGGEIQLSQEWTGTFNGTGPDAVFVGDNGNATVLDDFQVGAGGVVANLTGAKGFVHRAKTIDTQGNTFTNTGNFIFSFSGPTKTITGGGTFENASGGNMQWYQGPLELDGTDLANHGTFVFADGDTNTLSGTGTLQNAAGGTAEWSATDGAVASEIVVQAGASINNAGTLNIVGGETHKLSGDGAFINAAGGTMNWNAGNLRLETGATLQNDGTFVVSGADNRNLNGPGTIVNNGTYEVNPTSTGADNVLASDGRFVNHGLYDIKTPADFELGSGYTFEITPSGVLRKSGGGGDQSLFFKFGAGSTGGTLDNQGTVEVLIEELEIRSHTGNTGDFGQTTVAQYASADKELTGGTWIVRDPDAGGSGFARLDMQPANAGITTIGADAAVELTGPNALFPQLTGSLDEVAGAFEVNDRAFTIPGSNLTLSGGILSGTGTYVGDVIAEDGSIVAPGDGWGENVGTMTINSDLQMQAGSTLSIDIDGPNDYDRLVFASGGTLSLDGTELAIDLGYSPAVGESMVIVEGFDALGGAGIFDGLPHGANVMPGSPLRIFYNADNITLTGVPEPGAITLALLGLLLAGGFARRRRAP